MSVLEVMSGRPGAATSNSPSTNVIYFSLKATLMIGATWEERWLEKVNLDRFRMMQRIGVLVAGTADETVPGS
jgi:hypothetical protein